VVPADPDAVHAGLLPVSGQRLPRPWPGEIPLSLVALFLIGWPMRLWVVRRLTPEAPAAEGVE